MDTLNLRGITGTLQVENRLYGGMDRCKEYIDERGSTVMEGEINPKCEQWLMQRMEMAEWRRVLSPNRSYYVLIPITGELTDKLIEVKFNHPFCASVGNLSRRSLKLLLRY
ncbi:hypothetical protein EVAR_27780_1 [Eumeta japonica]|uniref:Uncharacterized protein n=1 Tax=Eumeta variegata TaxID=151549 RepID=A0A4C1VB79_EUMVA|nr:hypothetical protein EVAR_27780_1 [Eumeta japonica]